MSLLEHMMAELSVPVSSQARFAAMVRGWLDRAVPELFPEWDKGLRLRPVAGPKPVIIRTGPERPPRDAGPPWGEPGQIFGELKIRPSEWRSREMLYSDDVWPEFLAALEDASYGADVTVGALDERGYPPAEDFAWVSAERDRGWATFRFIVPAESTGWPLSPGKQEAWAGYLRDQANRIGACGGYMTDDKPPGFTALQLHTGRADVSVRDSRKVLLGYSWVTVVAPGLAKRLGGAGAMEASGAFYEVSTLRNGGLWLRATPTINEFTGDRIREAFEALAPVLITGAAVNWTGDKFRILEGVDAADYQ